MAATITIKIKKETYKLLEDENIKKRRALFTITKDTQIQQNLPKIVCICTIKTRTKRQSFTNAVRHTGRQKSR